LLDKTGTITFGNRMATEFISAGGISDERLADAAQLSSLADETPEGRSIVILAKEKYGLRGRTVSDIAAHFVPFTAQTQMSGVDIPARDGIAQRIIRKGSSEAIKTLLKQNGKNFPQSVQKAVDEIAHQGSTP
jgi:K+-transporting ATPase ATPase B chain